MAFCENCGTQVQDGVKFCPSCGNEIAAHKTQPDVTAARETTSPAAVAVQTAAPPTDAQANKMMAVLSYILFFIPLITGDHKKSPFVKYHTNQGIILFGISVAYGVISAILRAVIKVREDYGIWGSYSYTPGWLSTVLWVLSLGIAALCVYGIINAATGKTKPLPFIGSKITILK